MKIFFISAKVVQHDDYIVSVSPFRGVAFCDPVTGHWCSLRTGLTIAAYHGDELVIHSKRAVRSTWARGLCFRLPGRITTTTSAQ